MKKISRKRLREIIDYFLDEEKVSPAEMALLYIDSITPPSKKQFNEMTKLLKEVQPLDIITFTPQKPQN